MESQINANAFQTIVFPADRVEYVLQNKGKKNPNMHTIKKEAKIISRQNTKSRRERDATFNPQHTMYRDYLMQTLQKGQIQVHTHFG